ncbi:MAG: cupredoxin domain-containing protein [Nitrososphaeraceae archaeon]|nr:cupredoxin domain-containing protein [Nitrososphaeraceae archaeon]MDW0168711.1 cupredoxin domain-containing protein [Nitrososphaeraceae archaeon]MDW0172076.1 cupredoxin domain-containing protein [Nitrososphaeraceae archaeon]MDW0172659.1 cupredoxin domain-containing protein [Nitrososphaeraceae archaeon]MDW0175088.1 cupredoxin domain-containing protein [Nitrososphaeraceae archaeon]
MNSRLALVCTVGATLSFLIIGLYTTSNQMDALGQDNATVPKNETSSMAMMNANMSSGGKIPSLSTPGEKAFYVFTSEIEGVDEEKLKVAGDAFSVNTLVANKGDKVTVHFYNVDPVKEERHSFTVGDPYAVNIDVGFAESGNATFTADNVGVFPFYCKYHLPVMEGQLVVLP